MVRVSFAPLSVDGGDAAGLFTNMYLMFLGNTDNPNRAQSIEETRLAIKLLDAFDGISRITTREGFGNIRVLRDEGGDLVLDEPEQKLLLKAVDKFLETSPFVMARLGTRIRDMISAAPPLIEAAAIS